MTPLPLRLMIIEPTIRSHIRDRDNSSPHGDLGGHAPRPQPTSVPLVLRTMVLRFRESAGRVHDLASFRASHLGPVLCSPPATNPEFPFFRCGLMRPASHSISSRRENPIWFARLLSVVFFFASLQCGQNLLRPLVPTWVKVFAINFLRRTNQRRLYIFDFIALLSDVRNFLDPNVPTLK
jgi:hypothetical protein